MSYMKVQAPHIVAAAVFLLILSFVVWVLFWSNFALGSVRYVPILSDVSTERTLVQGKPVVHVDMPKEVKAIYMSACYGSSPTLRQTLVDLIEATELNAIIIDIKDYTGTIAIPTESALLQDGATGSGCKIKDAQAFVELLHSKGIYVIGRITVFQDPLYTKLHPDMAVHRMSAPTTPWKDNKGLSFVDVGAKPYWEYVVTLARESYALGFDELNFDYIRYPSDGPMGDVYYTHSGIDGKVGKDTRAHNLEQFFAYLHTELRKKDAWGRAPVLSADLFGMTTTNTDDLTIGQLLETTLPYFDAIAPMVYPSHYPSGFIGLSNPNNDVYAVVHYSMKRAVERTIATSTTIHSDAYTRIGTSTPALYEKPAYSTAKLRPWLQDFDYGGDYGPAEVRAQIKANSDAGVTGGWMLWSPSNKYTRGGLLP